MNITAALFGTLTRDAESKTSSGGKPYLRIIGLRVGDGDKAQWVSITAFDQDAIAIADKFVKGAPVYVEGPCRSTDGKPRTAATAAAYQSCRGIAGWRKSAATKQGARARQLPRPLPPAVPILATPRQARPRTTFQTRYLFERRHERANEHRPRARAVAADCARRARLRPQRG